MLGAMKEDVLVRRSVIWVVLMWAAVVWLMVAACVILAVDPSSGRWALMVAAVSILAAIAALAMNIHCWLRTTASLVRMCAREDERPSGLRAVP